MLKNHKKHDLVDLLELREEKREVLLRNVELLKIDLQSNREKILDTKQDLDGSLCKTDSVPDRKDNGNCDSNY